MQHEIILVLDFGSQYTQLIARRIRELNVYCEIVPFNKIPANDDPVWQKIRGVILSGSPASVREENSPNIDTETLRKRFPLLGVCYGAQLLAARNGGEVVASTIREYGRANISKLNTNSPLLKDIPTGSQVWMSHGDTIKTLPAGFEIIASTADVECAAFTIPGEPTYAIQFHPEVTHSTDGFQLIKNFIVDICGCRQDWTPGLFIEETVADLKQRLGNDKVILALSGGVDSTVAAGLLHRAIGANLYCIFVDNGLLRKNEYGKVLDSYLSMGLNVKGVNAVDRFLNDLKGVTNPETKRKTIGRNFIEVFDEESNRIEDVKWLAQGTIYPDVIESASVKGPSATIKSHHNVGGLPENMKLKIVEPLRSLFKDEVRRVGAALEIDPMILSRHPFPGPGLAVRILGEITPDNIRVLQEADDIFIEGLRKHGLYNEVWQAGAIFLPVQSVGVMGDERTYENVICLRAVTSTDGMTADWCRLPYDFFAQISNEIINKVRGVNRVVYDISSKPPATIEWE